MHRQPKLCGSSLDYEFIRECMKINKIGLKFQFWTKIETKITLCLCFVIYCLFASRAMAQFIVSVIASSTVGGSLGPFVREKARQNIMRVPGYLHSTERLSSLLRLLGLCCFLTEPFCFIHRTSYPTRAYNTYFATFLVTLIS